jgi:crotonobetainyl-CoA:carnitine CoA-transferase CaiB-like acyl-CoA transferase
VNRPLQGVKIVEVAMWAFVPAAGGMLCDMGANVIKIEPPNGDPLRGLKILSAGSGGEAFDLSWEAYNRGKRSVTLDLHIDAARDVLLKLVADADVFLTSLLPPARRKMKIDIDDLRAINPKLIYAIGSATGREGPEGEKGGYDAITFWGRGGIAAAVTPDTSPYPLQPPGPAYGDCTSAAMLAGGVSAAIAQRAMTGKASVVDVSLLGASMWSMQRTIMQANALGVTALPRPKREAASNPLVNVYRTKDGRFLSLCMLQGQRYWPQFCEAANRADLIEDPRFATAEARVANIAACVATLDALFAEHTLAEWRDILGRQDGQWELVQHAGEMKDDPQVQANRYMQAVEHGDDRTLEVVSVPIQFDGASLDARPAPQLGAHSEQVLAELGYDEQAILDLKIAGAVF